VRYDDRTSTYKSVDEAIAAWRPKACLLMAHEPFNKPHIDSHQFRRHIQVGRGRPNDVRLQDDNVSRKHFRIEIKDDIAYLVDRRSKNGTFLEGRRVTEPVPIEDGALIRAGQALFVFHLDARPFFDQPHIDDHGMAGQFHTPPLMRELKEATGAGRNILLAGPTGSGKELCAGAVAAMAERPLVAHNAARSTSEDEARASLFGVGPKVFSEVVERAGFIEQAHGGVLFLDEANALPWSVQKSLLRVLEDGKLTRIGETGERAVDVKFVLASNAPGPDHGLADDLTARLRQVKVPSLVERRADIPSIFEALLYREYERLDIDAPKRYYLLNADHFETMMLDGFERHNARGLQDLAERIATRIKATMKSTTAAISSPCRASTPTRRRTTTISPRA
jgi:MoxR-like ATPase